jgi:ATP-dependent helicase/nuclease subunit A
MSDDASARQQALDPSASFAVRAPAGSGKTTLLIQRLLRLLTTVEHPEQVVAITFTRKAAEEMRTRIVEALTRAAGAAPDDEFARHTWELAVATLAHDRALGWQLDEHPARLRIMTIDALCQHLVRRMPITAGMPGLPAVEDDVRQLYSEAARNALAAIADAGPTRQAVKLALHHVDNDWAKLEALLANMIERRDQWLPLIGAGSDREVLELCLRRTVEDELAKLVACLAPAILSELVALGTYAGANLPHSPLAEMVAMPAPEFDSLPVWQAFAGLFLTDPGAWRKKIDKRCGFPAQGTAAKAMKERWGEILAELQAMPGAHTCLVSVQRLPSSVFADSEWETVSALTTLLKSATAHFMVLCDQLGRSDFTAFSLAALDALGEPLYPSDLALSLDYQISHLLIDEFQDTSITQFELLRRLTAGWQEHDGRTLFLVGDPMQSIYRFRQADVNLFRRVLQVGRIGSVVVQPLTLSVNFRAQAQLVDWINSAMPQALAAIGAADDHFVGQSAVRRADIEPCVVHAFGQFDTRAEAERVCQIVNDLRVREPTASIAVLVRSRSHLGHIPALLMAAGIGVSAREITPFAELEVVADLSALCRALLHAADRVAWFSVLRAPWCGLSLSSLLALAELAPTVPEALGLAAIDERFEVTERARMLRVQTLLETARNAQREAPFAVVLQETWLALGGPAVLDDARSLDDARAFFRIIDALELEGITLTAERINKRLAQQYSSPPVSDAAAVQIMTVHRAKGLEFDYVIVPGLGRAPRGDARPLLLLREDIGSAGEHNLLLAPIPSRGKSPLYDYLRAREQNEGSAEIARLLYVALTRARNQVHLLGHAEGSLDADVSPAKGSFLSLLWSGLQHDFAARVEISVASNPAETSLVTLRRARPESLPCLALPPGTSNTPPIVPIEFEWAGTTAKHVGTVTHRLLQDLAERGAAVAPQTWLETALQFGRGQLRARGLVDDALHAALDVVREALETTLNSIRGRWLFDAGHRQSHSELCVAVSEEFGVARIVIDRTFIDHEGRLWIIDFKTGTHSGGAVEAYLDSEVLRYRPQLERYARGLAELEQRPIWLGLYFPLLDAWREWPYRPV